MTVTSRNEAWKNADRIFPTDYIKDENKSSRAGYDIFVSTASDNNSYICDLGDRLEVNLDNGETINIWIERPKQTERELDEILNKVDKYLYDMEDNLFMNEETGLNEAHKALYSVFGKVKAICDKFYPNSYLYEKYNLKDA